MTRASQLFPPSNGIHFSEPWQFLPLAVADSNLRINNGSAQSSATTAFFTEMAARGLQDTTDWTADTYKTLLSVSGGPCFVAGIVGPTAGGAETTTFEITVDGVLHQITISLTATLRAALLSKMMTTDDFVTAAIALQPNGEALGANKATFTGTYGTNTYIPVWRTMTGFPLLIAKQSLLIRAKHSANITNSTATAYSAVMYRLGL